MIENVKNNLFFFQTIMGPAFEWLMVYIKQNIYHIDDVYSVELVSNMIIFYSWEGKVERSFVSPLCEWYPALVIATLYVISSQTAM